jgi:cytochrome bd ubiquinol oxidase subunit II
MAILLVTAAFLRLGVSFWPYMIPFSVTVQQAAAPTQSLAFPFWGAGVIVVPVVLIYTAVVYWILRGKVGKVAPAYGPAFGQPSPRRVCANGAGVEPAFWQLARKHRV